MNKSRENSCTCLAATFSINISSLCWWKHNPGSIKFPPKLICCQKWVEYEHNLEETGLIYTVRLEDEVTEGERWQAERGCRAGGERSQGGRKPFKPAGGCLCWDLWVLWEPDLALRCQPLSLYLPLDAHTVSQQDWSIAGQVFLKWTSSGAW